MTVPLSVPITQNRTFVFGTEPSSISFPYYLRSGPNTTPELLGLLEDLHADCHILIADDGLPMEYVEPLVEAIADRLGDCTLLLFPADETHKRLETVETLSIQAERQAHITPNSVLIGLGGGLLNNVVGVLATLQFRGIRFVQIPTTLLSIADVMPSLKQAVNTTMGKNHLGVFSAPAFVWADITYLKTLPALEIQSALCEMIKFILTTFPDRFDSIAAQLRQDAVYTTEDYLLFIQVCLDAKCSLLEHDPWERGDGLIFEYGHTVGHALELLSYQHGYTPLPHGIAIGIGCVVAARVARLLGLLSPREEDMHRELLALNGVAPWLPSQMHPEDILKHMEHDTKRGRLQPLQDDELTMVLLRTLGEPNRTNETVLTQVGKDIILQALYDCHSIQRYRTRL